jgi:MoxR-like ATPase
MEEGEVSLEGVTRALPKPQVFIATQNPLDQIGTSLLPESELDRFTVHLRLGYPDPEQEKKILLGLPQEQLKHTPEVLSQGPLLEIQSKVEAVHVSETFLDLVIRLLNHCRSGGSFISPRAGRDLVRVSRALAFIRGRDFVTPDDLKFCMGAVVGHRIKDADEVIRCFSFQF